MFNLNRMLGVVLWSVFMCGQNFPAAGDILSSDDSGLVFVNDDAAFVVWADVPAAGRGSAPIVLLERLTIESVSPDRGRRPPRPRSLSPPA